MNDRIVKLETHIVELDSLIKAGKTLYIDDAHLSKIHHERQICSRELKQLKETQ
jgi:hypothetical protein